MCEELGGAGTKVPLIDYQDFSWQLCYLYREDEKTESEKSSLPPMEEKVQEANWNPLISILGLKLPVRF